MSFQTITCQLEKSVARVTINRPEKRNAMNPRVVAELREAILEAGNDPDVRIIILRGAGGNFSAGADLAYLQEIARNSTAENLEDSMRLMRMLQDWKFAPKPTIAIVEGYALAGGCGLAMTCDLILCAESAKLGFTEVRIGFVPAIVARLLIDRVGRGRALDLLLRGRILPAREAHAIGMISEVVADDLLEVRAGEITEEMVKETSPQAVALTKSLLGEMETLDTLEAMEYAAKINTFSRTTDDFRRGVGSFLEKKKILWG